MAWSPARPLRMLAIWLTVTAVAVATLPVGPVLADDEVSVCPDGPPGSTPFTDIAGGTHERTIACLVDLGITLGTTATTYSPATAVRRDQMAAFLVRMVREAGATLPPGTVSFADVEGNRHADAISRLATVGIVQGVAAGRYEPTRTVTRGQMATFLIRTYEFLINGAVSAGPSSFTDTVGTTHADNIDKAAHLGIAQGRTATTYAPGAAVRRDQMASFLIRVLDRLLQVRDALDADVPPPTFRVDAALTPEIGELLPWGDGGRRRVVVLADDQGTSTDLVADELLLAGPRTEVEAFIASVDGEVVQAPVPSAAAGLPAMWTVRVPAARIDAARVGAAELAERLREVHWSATGAHRVSDDAILGLLALSLEARAVGLSASPNPVWSGASVNVEVPVTDAPAGDAMKGSAAGATSFPYTSDIRQWRHLASQTVQDIGVPEAWRALTVSRRDQLSVNERIRILVLDGGFANLDLPPGSLGANNRASVLSNCGGQPCPWHGTGVTQTAVAVPGNNIGVAGTGGPVATATMVGDSNVFDVALFYALMVFNTGSLPSPIRIVNMSFGGSVSAVLVPLAAPLVLPVLSGVSSLDILLVASAGNAGKFLNAETCVFSGTIFRFCFETSQTWPCQAGSVMCVGGLDVESRSHHPNSNYGSSVEIWAPFTVYTGPGGATPTDNRARSSNGTSYSAPYVSGVAALVMAADPGRSAAGVRSDLNRTARAGTGRVNRYVQARTVVYDRLGGAPPQLRFVSPPSGTQVVRGRSFPAVVDATSGMSVIWRFNGRIIDVDGTRVTVPGSVTSGLAPGTYELSATVARTPYVLTRAINIEVVNAEPQVTIERPFVGEEIYASDAEVRLQARVTNPERVLDDSEISWQVVRAGGTVQTIATGREATIAAAVLGQGTWTLRAVANDGVSTGQDEVAVTVRPDPAAAPPVIRITGVAGPTQTEVETTFIANQPLADSGGSTGSLWGAPVSFFAEARESADDPTLLSAPQVFWTSTYAYLQSGPTQTELLGSGTPITVTLATPFACLPGPVSTLHTVTVTAQNSAGVRRSDQIVIEMRSLPC